jgi:hypothetical protein
VSSNYGLLQVCLNEVLNNRLTIGTNPQKELHYNIRYPISFVSTFQYSNGEDLKQELNDVDNLTVERLLDEMSELFLKDYKNGQLKSRAWMACRF